jgi:hypothetical protein
MTDVTRLLVGTVCCGSIASLAAVESIFGKRNGYTGIVDATGALDGGRGHG